MLSIVSESLSQMGHRIEGVAFSLARVVEARFANQGPTTTSATPNLKPPTSPILTIGGSQNKASDSPTAPEVAHEVAPQKLYEKLLQPLTRLQRLKRLEASTFEELKHQLSTTPVLSLPDFNEVFLIEAECDRHGAVRRTHSYT
ncbi:hypothetical protein Tco_0606123 [Tanacetum coccineum]